MSFLSFGLPTSLAIAQGLTVGGTATLAGLVVGVYTVTVNGNATLNQDVSTAGSPVFTAINNTPIGSGTANTGAFTTLSASSTVSGAGFTSLFASPPAIGGTSAAAGSFTTLSASSGITANSAGGAITTTASSNGLIYWQLDNTSAGTAAQVAFATTTSGGYQGLFYQQGGGFTTSGALIQNYATLVGTYGLSLWSENAAFKVFTGSGAGTLALTLDTSQNATFAGSATATGFTISGGGTGTVTASSGVFSITSDKRAKNPHGDFTLGLDAIRHLSPVLYDFKSDDKHLERAGFYTQDVEPWIKQAVFHDQPNGMASLDDRPILAATVNAVKETDVEVQALRKRVAVLEAKLKIAA